MGRQINTLVAILKPPSNYMTIPVLQDSPSIDLRTDPYCALNDADNDQLLYQLLITDFSRCGVEDCSDDSEVSINLKLLYTNRISNMIKWGFKYVKTAELSEL